MSFDSVKPYMKALVGALTAGLGAYATALDDGVTTQEWITVILAALAGGGFVFGVPNKDPEAKHQRESVQPPEPGAVQEVVSDALRQPWRGDEGI